MKKSFAILLLLSDIAQPVVAVNRSENPVLDTTEYSLYLYRQSEIDLANERWYIEQERLKKERNQIRELEGTGCQSQEKRYERLWKLTKRVTIMGKEMVLPFLSVQKSGSGFLATISFTGDETKVTGASVTEVGAIGVALQNLESVFMDKNMTPIKIGVRLYRGWG